MRRFLLTSLFPSGLINKDGSYCELRQLQLSAHLLLEHAP
jgi:hypothetical protein